MNRSPPEGPPALAGLTPALIFAETEGILANSKALHDRLSTELRPETASFANVLCPLVDDANCAASRLHIIGALASAVWPDPDVREAARQCEMRVAAADTKAAMRTDIAALVAAVFQRIDGGRDDGVEELDAEDRYLLARKHSEYLRSGAGIDDVTKQARLQDALAELTVLRVAAQKALTEAEDGVWFAPCDLAGLPDRILSKLKRREVSSGEEVFVTFGNEHRLNMMRHARREATRRRMYTAGQYRFPDNVTRLAKIVELRDEIARLLGFVNHAALKMEEKMAGSVAEVEELLRELRERLEPLAVADTEKLRLLKLKDAAAAEYGEVEDASRLYVWDRSYYLNMQNKESFSVDTTELASYFEATHTFCRMLCVFEQLFGMHFKPTEADIWHHDVKVYAVWDSATDGVGFLGYLYADLFERPGKYRGAHHRLMKPVSTLSHITLTLPILSV